ncbi:helix-turn-helix domain-containing protein [Streptomyces buecherae]|uniref:helix-turn-helix domain-containing protein n=1 Tax=Streptomyces buecherae TaxID=2763006 RepID=UPI003791DF56
MQVQFANCSSARRDGLAAGDPPEVLRQILGAQLKELRESAGRSYLEAARAVGVSEATIRRMEAGQATRYLRASLMALLDCYGVTAREKAEAVQRLADEASQPSWWHPYRDVAPEWLRTRIGLDEAAQLIRGYAPQHVPDLLQTEEYARALLHADDPLTAPDPERTERRVELRMRRQALLRREEPPRLWIVLDETVLRWPVGGPKVMGDQVARLLELSALPHVTLQLMPYELGPHVAAGAGAFTVFRVRARELPDIVSSENELTAPSIDTKREHVARYQAALDHLCAQALQASASRDRLGELHAHWSDAPHGTGG